MPTNTFSARQLLLVLLLLLFVAHYTSAQWQQGSLPASFASIKLKTEGFTREPARGSTYYYKTPWDAQTFEFCSRTAALNISCVDYFCSADTSLLVPTTLEQQQQQFAMMNNYCQYCEHDSFVQFHSMVRNGTCAHRFVQYTNFSDCGTGNWPWLYHRALVMNQSALVKLKGTPYLCFCTQLNKLGSECGAMTAFFDDLLHEGFFIFNLVFGMVSMILIIVCIMVPECGIKHREATTHGHACKERCMSLFSIRMQSIYLLLISLFLFVVDNAVELAVFSTHSLTLLYAMPNAVFYIFSLMTLFASYATMLILWSSVYTKANEGSSDASLGRKHIIATIIFYIIIVAALAVIIITLAILARTHLFIVAYALAVVVAIGFFIVFPLGFTIYGCLILRFGTVQKKITIFMILTNIIFLLLILLMLPMLLTFVLGWDWLGRTFASFRYVMTFFVPLLLTPPMFYILFVSRRFKLFYGCNFKNVAAK